MSRSAFGHEVSTPQEIINKHEHMTREQLDAFLKETIVPTAEASALTHCVDGRYQDAAKLAKPGANAGDVMVAMAALRALGVVVDHQKVIDLVVDLVGGPGAFAFHTDTHAEHDQKGPGMGCGHLKQAFTEPEAYGLTHQDMDYLMQKLPKLMEQGAQQTVLEGDHQEQAVVVVNAENYTVKPNVQSNGSVAEAFVFQRTANDKHLQALAEKLAQLLVAEHPNINHEQVHQTVFQVSDQQLQETLRRLAKDLRVYTVTVAPDKTYQIT
jgi:spore germination protein YaaH